MVRHNVDDREVATFIMELSLKYGVDPGVLWHILEEYMKYCHDIWEIQTRSWN